uniref:All-trans-retinol 13,14-reductase n=1 Tax=Varanus komodoensis TaxID=61221 RepID=A0A8D2LJB7_VARKO
MWAQLLLLGAALALAGLWACLGSRRGSRNPFVADARRPPAPLVTERDTRKRVLKQGIHYIGQMQEGSSLRMMIDQLTDGQLQWAKMDSPFDVVIFGDQESNRRYFLYSGEKEYVEGLKRQFPGEDANIDGFVTLIKRVAKGSAHIAVLKMLPMPLVKFLHCSGLLALISPFFRMVSKSVSDVVSELTTNAELRAVFSYIFPTHGAFPAQSSFPLHAVLVDHFLEGGWYPQGGASEIAFHSIPIIERAGGAVLTKAPVQNILVNSQGKAYGVSVKKGQDTVNIYAPVVISDAGIFNTYERLLPAKWQALTEIQNQLSMVHHGIAGFSLFIGLKGSKEELGLEAKNYFIYRHNDLDEAYISYFNSSRETAAKNIPSLYIGCPSAKDPLWEKRYPGKSVLTILTAAKYEWFEEWKEEKVTKRGKEYESFKSSFVESIMESILKFYPQIEDKIELISAGTPLTNCHYIGSPRGEIYGAENSISRLQVEVTATVRPQTPIPNLYLTGQDVFLGGFPGALHGALVCASAVLQRNLYVDFMWLERKLKANSLKKNN